MGGVGLVRADPSLVLDVLDESGFSPSSNCLISDELVLPIWSAPAKAVPALAVEPAEMA